MKMGLIFQSYFSGLLVLAILFLLAFFWYKKYVSPFSKFPSSWIVLKIFLNVIRGKIPTDGRLSSCIFRLLVEECKPFISEGFYVLWLPKPHIVIFNEEAFKVISSEANHKSWLNEILEDALGSGILNSNGELWRYRRKLLHPAFQISVLKNYVSVFSENSATMVQDLMEVQNEPVEIIKYLKRSNVDSIFRTILGIDKYGPTKEADIVKFIELTDICATLISKQIINPLLQWKLTKHLFPDGRLCTKSLNEGYATTDKVLLKMKDAAVSRKQNKTITEEEYNYLPTRRSFADIVIERHLQDPLTFTFQDMKDEFHVATIAGYHTVSYAITWCLLLLGNDQEVQDQFYNEVEHLKGKELSYDDIKDLEYVDCVVKESLRLRPVVPIYLRLIERDMEFGKYKIPEGTSVFLCPYLLHRNPEAFPNPEKFDPERFRGSNNKNPWSYTAFSEGIRNCIGKNFALIQMKVALIHILLNFRVTSMDRFEDIQAGFEISLIPSQPVKIKLTPRC